MYVLKAFIPFELLSLFSRICSIPKVWYNKNQDITKVIKSKTVQVNAHIFLCKLHNVSQNPGVVLENEEFNPTDCTSISSVPRVSSQTKQETGGTEGFEQEGSTPGKQPLFRIRYQHRRHLRGCHLKERKSCVIFC